MPDGGRIRLLISDVDGTLVTSDKRLTPATVAAVARLREAGIAFAVVSSRPPRGMAMLVEPLGIDTFLAGFNGGAIVRPDLSPVEERVLPQLASQIALDAFRLAGVDIWVFAGNDWLIADPDGPYVARERRAVQFDPVVVTDFAPYFAHAGKIVGSSRDFDLLAQIERDLEQRLEGTASARRSQPYYLDVTHGDANKGSAARALASLVGVTMEEVACIGDMANDLPMLQLAGLAIAMGNAPRNVQAAAHEITATNDADGFADAVERAVLPRAVPTRA